MVGMKSLVGIALLAVATVGTIAAFNFATAALVDGGLLLIYAVRQRALDDTHERAQRREDTPRRPK